eukprot:GILK01025116.1.p1 GENE.GILK01025116.1~~GILK01025116.1.p1  ORF type:complete len:128 (-),score=0.69 GILK01025116.1:62-445(-)
MRYFCLVLCCLLVLFDISSAGQSGNIAAAAAPPYPPYYTPFPTPPYCGYSDLVCIATQVRRCINGVWTCVPISDPTPICPVFILCRIGYRPVCNDGIARCLPNDVYQPPPYPLPRPIPYGVNDLLGG